MQEEFVRGHHLFQSHLLKGIFPGAALFELSTGEFFQKYPRYIQIDISAANATDHRIW
jgi:hypothetical protein